MKSQCISRHAVRIIEENRLQEVSGVARQLRKRIQMRLVAGRTRTDRLRYQLAVLEGVFDELTRSVGPLREEERWNEVVVNRNGHLADQIPPAGDSRTLDPAPSASPA